MGKPKGQDQALAASKQATENAQTTFQQSQAAYNKISPFATALMSLGLDPKTFASSPLGQGILAQGRQGISQNFQGARNNLAENLGSSGLGGSGVGLGPLANLYGQEAGANSKLQQDLPLMGLQLGQQGAQTLTGQQQILNPGGWAETGISGFEHIPQGGFGQSFLGALGSGLGDSAAAWTRPLFSGGTPGSGSGSAGGAFV